MYVFARRLEGHAVVALLSSLPFESFPKFSLPPRESQPEDIFRIQGLDLLAFSILLPSLLKAESAPLWVPGVTVVHTGIRPA